MIGRPARRTLAPVVVAALALALAAAGLVGVVAISAAPTAPSQPAPPLEADGLIVIGHHDLDQSPGNTSDVWYMHDTAYVGYRCGEDKGSSIVDVTDPTSPQVHFQTEVMSRTFANDVKALAMDTASFTGDLFIEPHDRCSSQGPPAETRFYDVTDPSKPELISSLPHGDGVHNAYAFQRGDNAYVLLAAPGAEVRDNEDEGYEDIDLDADFSIVDITNPAFPAVVGAWTIRDKVDDLAGSVFVHDVWANADGTLAYLSFWDAGLVLLDISDVRDPVMISRLSYLDKGAGNTHAAVPDKTGNYLVITDEDFGPTDGKFEVLEPADIAGDKDSYAGNFANMLMGQPMLEGDAAWVGRGCAVDPAYPGIIEDDPYLNDATGKIAMIVRGGCSFANKILRAENEGAIGAVIINNNPGGSPPPMGGGDPQITIPGTGIGYEDGNAITTTLESSVNVRLRFGIVAGEWGFTRIADYTDPANPRLIAEYTIDETREFPPPSGSYSVHNPWVVGDMLYLSYYWAGVRMVDISDPFNPEEHAYLIPASTGDSHSSVWGVITDEDGVIYASDILGGLWILEESDEPQPTAAPTDQPTQGSTDQPTDAPTQAPTDVPTGAPTDAPTGVPTDVPPPPTSTPVPGGPNVCPQIANKVPAAAIQAALANPDLVAGYKQPLDPSKPVGPFNPERTWLSLRTYAKPYHPTFNGLVFKAGCP